MRPVRLAAPLTCVLAAVSLAWSLPEGAAGKAGWPPPAAERPVAIHAEAKPPTARPGAGEAAWNDLLEGNRRFVRGLTTPRDVARRRAELLEAQHPVAAVLGCSDSRVPPELLFDRGLGDLFVVRTAGNVADKVALGSLEYAVEHLGVPLLVVLGHERCGAVAAAATGEVPQSPNLADVVARIAPGLERLRGVVEGPGLVQLGVDVNVHRSARALLDESDVLRRAVLEGRLTIVRAVYRLGTGEAVRLD